MLLADSPSAPTSVVLSKKSTRIKKTFALSSETIKYDSIKTLFRQIIDSKSYQHMIKILSMLNSNEDVSESDESQNLKEIMTLFY